MKIFAAILFMFVFTQLLHAVHPDDILGYWLTDDGKSQIEIYKQGGKYQGKIVWLEEPYEEDGSIKRDDENPDESLRSRSLKGLQILRNFEYDSGDDEWDDGKIYDPESGNTYDCYIWFEDNDTNTLNVKGYMGLSIIGRTTEWTREPSKRE